MSQPIEVPATEPIVASGQIVALRLFDVAYAIDLAAAEALWTRHTAGGASRARLAVTPPKAMEFGVPPLSIVLDPLTLTIDGIDMPAAITARLYDFGAVTLALRVRSDALPWREFADRVNATERCLAGPDGAAVWDRALGTVRGIVAAALERPSVSDLAEDYLIAVVHGFDTPLTAAEVLARADLVPLLSGETRQLSDAARNDLLRRQFSYYEDDLVVLTWDRAFIYEPRGDSDVADVLEVANVQLLEMRYYDELLDDELPRMNDLVETARGGLNVLASRRYAGLARKLYTLVADVTELTEKVDNALQVTEDVYLARVYGAALDLFRVGLVSAAVHRKLAIIRDTYTALYDEASSARTELMEAAILLLIFVELVIAVTR
ncbi:MAG: hypothetical protein NT133_20065 [Alphaproteobacteria bacterium]|nr:hypothetical protein [Alphaproteobacteria bacterium]